MQKVVIYPGTFNPITKGHMSLVKSALNIFEHLIIGIGINAQKNNLFTPEERKALCEEALKAYGDRVSVELIDGLLVDFAKEKQVNVVLRGIRNYTDWEYEYQMSSANRELYDNLEYIFLLPAQNESFISSSLVREIAHFNGEIDRFVPKNVSQALQKKLKESNKVVC